MRAVYAFLAGVCELAVVAAGLAVLLLAAGLLL
jgi:hypothetical protein